LFFPRNFNRVEGQQTEDLKCDKEVCENQKDATETDMRA